MIRIIADDKIPFLKGVLEPYAKVTYLPGNQINRNSISGTDALLVRTRTRCNPELAFRYSGEIHWYCYYRI